MGSGELLFFLLIVILVLLEGVLGKRKRAQQPQQPQQRRSRPQSPAPPAPAKPAEMARPRAAERASAQVLIPEDLWAEITGTRRERKEPEELLEAVSLEKTEGEEAATLERMEREVPAPAGRAAPTVERAPAAAAGSERLRRPPADRQRERLRLERERGRPELERPRAQPAEEGREHARRIQQMRTLETRLAQKARAMAAAEEEVQAEARHEAFHKRMVAPGPELAPARPRAAAARVRLAPRSPAELRRAIVLKEILDPPLTLRGPEGDRG